MIEDEVDRLVAEATAKLRDQQRRIEDMRRALARKQIVGHTRNGEVTAKLVGTGQFTEIQIDPQVLCRNGAETVGELVLEAVNDGLRRLAEATRAMVAPFQAEASAEQAERLSDRV